MDQFGGFINIPTHLQKQVDELFKLFDKTHYIGDLREMIDLYNRVEAVTGEIVSFDNIHLSGTALNRRVDGVKRSAYVETIQAGGYHIQRLHLRVLVKPI